MSHDPDRLASSRSARYRVELLAGARPLLCGLSFGAGDRRGVLAWTRIRLAFAAEVGEPEGVRTIVFDLVVDEEASASAGAHSGRCYRAYRLDADPGEEAMELARAIERGLGKERPSASIKCVATDGVPSRWYPDLRSFEEAVLAELD
jgi:hypothetical protein